MADKYLIGSNKMMWHPDTITKWLNGETIAPLYIDVGLSKGCNIRCHYCFGVLQENLYKNGYEFYFPREPLLRYMRDAGKAGVKSMGIIGEGEPTLNPHLYDAINEGYINGIDMALATNGILFDINNKGRQSLEQLTWIRFNLSASTNKAYRKLHGSKEWNTLMKNIKFCVNTKKENGLNVTIGIQMVLTPSDVNQTIPLAKLGKELGVDYFQIKQCGDSQDNRIGIYNELYKYKEYIDTIKKAEEETTDTYNVIPKWKSLLGEGKRYYDQCLGAPFILYSDGMGRIFTCGAFFDNKYLDKYILGDLKKSSFIDIINSKRYREIIEKVKKIDVHKFCYNECRTHSINEYIWKLKHPPEHKNFV